MDGIVARDPRVGAILRAPDDYFARALREAWLKAQEDVGADLARRAERRRNGATGLDEESEKRSSGSS